MNLIPGLKFQIDRECNSKRSIESSICESFLPINPTYQSTTPMNDEV